MPHERQQLGAEDVHPCPHLVASERQLGERPSREVIRERRLSVLKDHEPPFKLAAATLGLYELERECVQVRQVSCFHTPLSAPSVRFFRKSVCF